MEKWRSIILSWNRRHWPRYCLTIFSGVNISSKSLKLFDPLKMKWGWVLMSLTLIISDMRFSLTAQSRQKFSTSLYSLWHCGQYFVSAITSHSHMSNSFKISSFLINVLDNLHSDSGKSKLFMTCLFSVSSTR